MKRKKLGTSVMEINAALSCFGKEHALNKSNDDDNEEDEEDQPHGSKNAISGLYFYVCGLDAALSNHYCINTGKWVMA